MIPLRRHRVRPAVTAAALACAALFCTATTAAAQRQCDDRCPLVGSYNTASFVFHPSHTETNALAGAGRVWLTAPDGRWLVRTDLLAGMSFYTSLARNFGYLAGLNAAGIYTFVGDYLAVASSPVEAYLTAGGGAYHGWRLEEEGEERGVVPVVQAGVGMRFHGTEPLGRVVLVEIVYEERIGAWEPLVLVRMSLAFARRGR